MPLDMARFSGTLAWLSERFTRGGDALPERLVVTYYKMLAPHLDDDTFDEAARIIYFTDRFWPPPARFLEAAGRDAASDAERAWTVALAEASRGEGRRLSEYEPAHAAALLAVGGNATIGRTHADRIAFVKREFVAAYTRHRERTLATDDGDRRDALPQAEPAVLPGFDS